MVQSRVTTGGSDALKKLRASAAIFFCEKIGRQQAIGVASRYGFLNE
jgi:hypothetical protein